MKRLDPLLCSSMQLAWLVPGARQACVEHQLLHKHTCLVQAACCQYISYHCVNLCVWCTRTCMEIKLWGGVLFCVWQLLMQERTLDDVLQWCTYGYCQTCRC